MDISHFLKRVTNNYNKQIMQALVFEDKDTHSVVVRYQDIQEGLELLLLEELQESNYNLSYLSDCNFQFSDPITQETVYEGTIQVRMMPKNCLRGIKITYSIVDINYTFDDSLN